MSESLAFYLSTNTFSNPMFEEHTQQTAPNQAIYDEQRDRQTRKGSRLLARCAELCDNLLFSVKSKLFVLELNFKRSLRRVRSFAERQSFGLNAKPRSVHQQNQPIQPTPWLSDALETSRCVSHSDSVNGNSRDQRRGDKFWKSIGQAPDSRESLGLQKQKILNRLEQAVQAKRINQQRVVDPGVEFYKLLDRNEPNSGSGWREDAVSAERAKSGPRESPARDPKSLWLLSLAVGSKNKRQAGGIENNNLPTLGHSGLGFEASLPSCPSETEDRHLGRSEQSPSASGVS